MDCNVVRDLIPLYIDECCSEESAIIVKEHIESCDACKKLLEDMSTPSDVVAASKAPAKFNKLNDWKASVLQSVLLFLSFSLITIGVSLEARTGSGLMNGFWAMNLVIPATGFMLSLANWYFVQVYKNRKRFSSFSLIATLGITLCAYIWSVFHYEMDLLEIFSECNFVEALDAMQGVLFLNGLGIVLTVAFCILSKILSNQYAKMLGKE
ncbi:MAG: hypothetical protein E7568_03655 [Ruminococcaceae bacterium]|nr:hypothetical protein [Oscillospiraceae bacterium]